MVMPPQRPESKITIAEKTGGMKLPSGYTIYVVMLVIALVASFGINYVLGVSKAELSDYKKTTTASIESMASDLNASKSSLDRGIKDIPTAIDTKVATAISTVTARLTAVETDAKTAKENSLSAVNQAGKSTSDISSINKMISELQTQINSVKSDITAIKTSLGNNTDVTSIQAALTTATNRIATLEAQVTTLNNQYALASITVNTASAVYSVTSGVVTSIPLSLTNSSDKAITVPMKFTMTTANAVVVSAVAMTSSSLATYSGTTVVFEINVYVGANSSVLANIPIAISYTGTSPNNWTGVWSKK